MASVPWWSGWIFWPTYSVRSTLILSLPILLLKADVLLLVVLIPIYLIRQVQIRICQKLVLGISLCLSIMMVITAVIRISGVRVWHHDDEIIWRIFWIFNESCASIIMVSLTAFRSLFVMHQNQRAEKRRRDLTWKQPRKQHVHKPETGSENEMFGGLSETSDVILAGIISTVEDVEMQNKAAGHQIPCVLQDVAPAHINR